MICVIFGCKFYSGNIYGTYIILSSLRAMLRKIAKEIDSLDLQTLQCILWDISLIKPLGNLIFIFFKTLFGC